MTGLGGHQIAALLAFRWLLQRNQELEAWAACETFERRMLGTVHVVIVLERERQGSECKGHPWLHRKFEAILGYMRPYLKQKIRNSV